MPVASERASPGLGALFGTLRRDRSYSILELGEGSNRQMEALAPYARIIRFVGWVPGDAAGAGARLRPADLPEHPACPYDVVLAWSVLDRLGAEGRVALIRRLAEITADTAWIYASTAAPEAEMLQPVRSTLIGTDRVEEEPVGSPIPGGPRLLPAQAEQLLNPFWVTQAFSLRSGLREYVARKAV